MARPLALIAFVIAFAAPAVFAQDATGSALRVFLRSGDALVSYGEAAFAGERVIFTMVLGGDDSPYRRYELVDLPADAVDVERTLAYADAARAAFYTATRAEADYVEMVSSVADALDRLPGIGDPVGRLEAAEAARARMVDFSRRSYGYRAAETGALLSQFDAVLADLRVAAGRTGFEVELSSGPVIRRREPLLSPPNQRESIRLALAAAQAADEGLGRIGILRSAAAALPPDAAHDDLRVEVRRRLELETAIEHRYAALARRLLVRAEEARRQGDPGRTEALLAELDAADVELGRSRPRVTERVRGQLERLRAEAHAHRLALDHYASVRQSLLAYERRIRRPLGALDGLRPVLQAFTERQHLSFDRLLAAGARLERIGDQLGAAAPPSDLAGVHATFVSAIHLAREAVARRKEGAVTADAAPVRDASSAAAGALMLIDRAREDLVVSLFPPRIQ